MAGGRTGQQKGNRGRGTGFVFFFVFCCRIAGTFDLTSDHKENSGPVNICRIYFSKWSDIRWTPVCVGERWLKPENALSTTDGGGLFVDLNVKLTLNDLGDC